MQQQLQKLAELGKSSIISKKSFILVDRSIEKYDKKARDILVNKSQVYEEL